MPREYEGAFGDKQLRCRLVCLASIIDGAVCLVVTIPTAIGTFLSGPRDFAQEYLILHACVSGAAIVAAAAVYLAVLIMGTLLHKRRTNFYLMLLVVALVAVAFYGFACLADVGVALGVALAPEAMMICIFGFSFFLDVAAYPLYLISITIVMTPMLGAYCHLYIENMIQLTWLIVAPIIAFVLCLHIVLNTLYSIRTVEETHLGENDIIQEAVFILVGGAACQKWCKGKDRGGNPAESRLGRQ